MKCKALLKYVSTVLSISLLTLALTGCQPAGNDTDASGSKYPHRVILVSDMHYTTQETTEELKELYPDANTSGAAGDTYGHSQQEKIQAIMDDIDAFNEKNPIDAIFVLGDLSLDDYGFRNLPESYLQKFREDFLDKLSYPWYALAGNHDSYPNDEWKSIMGTDRQFSIKVGDAVFIMLDTFAPETATGASGSPYVGVDTEFLKAELEKYPTETIYLCSHYYEANGSNLALTRLIKDNDRIVCMFRGHTHNNKVLAPESLNYKCLFDIGAYAYDGDDSSGSWDFSQFDDDWAWGYTVLEWNETEAHVYHVKTPRKYIASNGTFDYVGCIEDEMYIEIKKGE